MHLWSPWRATAVEHRLFEVVAKTLKEPPEQFPDGMQMVINDPKTWRNALQAVSRVLKGWQEDAEPGNGERRSWRWMIEANTDGNGYDHAGETACTWAFFASASITASRASRTRARTSTSTASGCRSGLSKLKLRAHSHLDQLIGFRHIHVECRRFRQQHANPDPDLVQHAHRHAQHQQALKVRRRQQQHT